jgi:hypothetical protein
MVHSFLRIDQHQATTTIVKIVMQMMAGQSVVVMNYPDATWVLVAWSARSAES